MRTSIPALAICASIALPFSLPGESTGTCANPFEAPALPEHEIAMTVRAGDVTIAGTDAPVLRVSCTLHDRGSANEVRISFAANHLTIRGGPDGNAHFRIEIPAKTNLLVRTSAGNLTVSGITGDKDIELRAGNLTIEVGNAADYRRAGAFVLAGNLMAPAFGVGKDGLFRSFNKDNAAGRYRLHAEVLAGNLLLK